MNMLVVYRDAKKDKQAFGHLDFLMHFHLQKHKMAKWKHMFDADPAFWEVMKEKENRKQTESLPHWFTFVFTWFATGLSGPFGTVSTFTAQFVESFWNNDFKTSVLNFHSIQKYLEPSPESFVFTQNDSHNCGVCCLIFMIDLVCSQVSNTWNVKPTAKGETMPPKIQFGSTFLKLSGKEQLIQ